MSNPVFTEMSQPVALYNIAELLCTGISKENNQWIFSLKTKGEQCNYVDYYVEYSEFCVIISAFAWHKKDYTKTCVWLNLPLRHLQIVSTILAGIYVYSN